MMLPARARTSPALPTRRRAKGLTISPPALGVDEPLCEKDEEGRHGKEINDPAGVHDAGGEVLEIELERKGGEDPSQVARRPLGQEARDEQGGHDGYRKQGGHDLI